MSADVTVSQRPGVFRGLARAALWSLSLAGLLSLSLPGAALAAGDVKAGKSVFKKCKACHTVKEGKNRVGPSLFGIVDAPAGAVEGFRYSDALAQSGLVWDDATLAAFLSAPREVVPGNRMAFPGLKKQSDIDNLIAYLTAQSK
ncbi:cytochrome c family protein [Phaeobacter sp.]|uniref:c-type cytochrome n=1 Tax=Phaeobacter sp. TaxID=1902409 RepID=UPI0025DE4C33|nr:cytochrome c family protein [Phaeobacter sp.]